MFKRFLGLGLAAAMLFSPAAASEIKDVSDKVTVCFNGEDAFAESDVKPLMINDRTMVGLGAMFELLNFSAEYDENTKTAWFKEIGGDAEYGFTAEECEVIKKSIADGKTERAAIMSDAAVIYNDRFYIPIREFCNIFPEMFIVEWNADKNTANIIYMPNVETTESAIRKSAVRTAATAESVKAAKDSYAERTADLNAAGEYAVQIMDNIYKFPLSVGDFLNDGWRLVSMTTFDIAPNRTSLLCFENSGVVLYFRIWNPTDKKQSMEKCYVSGVSTFFKDCDTRGAVFFSGGMHFGMKAAEVAKILEDRGKELSYMSKIKENERCFLSVETETEEAAYGFDDNGALENVYINRTSFDEKEDLPDEK